MHPHMSHIRPRCLAKETTTDAAWFVLAAARDQQRLEEGEALAAESWGFVDGANVAPMWGSVKHASSADLLQELF